MSLTAHDLTALEQMLVRCQCLQSRASVRAHTQRSSDCRTVGFPVEQCLCAESCLVGLLWVSQGGCTRAVGTMEDSSPSIFPGCLLQVPCANSSCAACLGESRSPAGLGLGTVCGGEAGQEGLSLGWVAHRDAPGRTSFRVPLSPHSH